MGLLSKFEGKVEDAMEGVGGSISRSPISPVHISKRCEKAMLRNKMVGAGKQYAPTLFTVLVCPNDDSRLFSFYPTLAGEIETYLSAKAAQEGLTMDGAPLVRFIADNHLKHGKFDVVAELVAGGIVEQLRLEEMERYGLLTPQESISVCTHKNDNPEDISSQQLQAPIGYGQNAPALENNVSAEKDVDPYAPPSVPEQEEIIPKEQNDIALHNNTQPLITPARLYDETNNARYKFQKPMLIAGRSQECDIVIPDINASRKHAHFEINERGDWVVKDLGSSNGTYVNGNRISKPVVLSTGDIIAMGLTKYRFEVLSSPTSTQHNNANGSYTSTFSSTKSYK